MLTISRWGSLLASIHRQMIATATPKGLRMYRVPALLIERSVAERCKGPADTQLDLL